ncbi:unnamed protein product [Effrenium voratum]|nr:unnamed protein product [Effrenium voratum]
MRVCVRFAVTGVEVLSLELAPTDLLEQVHRAVAKVLGVAGTRQQLLLGHQLLEPSMALRCLSDWEELSLELVLRAKGFVATASQDGTARIWDSQGHCVHTLEGHKDSVKLAVFSPDGFLLLTAAGGRGGRPKIWSVLTGRCVQVLPQHPYAVALAAFSSDSRVLVATMDGTARLWHVSGQLLQRFQHRGTVTSAEFSKNELLTGSWDKTAKIWKLRSPKAAGLAQKVLGCFSCFQQSRDDCITLEGHQHAVLSACYGPNCVLTASVDGTAKIWDRRGVLEQTLQGHALGVFSASFSADSRLVLTASWDRTAKIWDAARGVCLKTLEGHGLAVRSALFSKDGAAVLTASDDGSAKIWNAGSGACLRTLARPGHAIRVAVFSPDASVVLTSFDDGTAQLWDAGTGLCLQTLKGHDRSVKFARFSP